MYVELAYNFCDYGVKAIKKMDDYSGDVPFIDSEHPELVVVPYQLDTNDMKLWLNAGYTPDMWLKYAKDTFETLYREGE